MEKLTLSVWFWGFWCVYARERENKGLHNSPGLWCPSACLTLGYLFLLSIQKGIIFSSKEVGKVSVLSWFCEKLSGKGLAICD